MKRTDRIAAQVTMDWVLIGALAASAAVDFWAWRQARERSRNWDRAIKIDLTDAGSEPSERGVSRPG